MNRNWNVFRGRLEEAERPLPHPRRQCSVPVVFTVSLSWPVKVTIGRPGRQRRSRFIHVFRTTPIHRISACANARG